MVGPQNAQAALVIFSGNNGEKLTVFCLFARVIDQLKQLWNTGGFSNRNTTKVAATLDALVMRNQRGALGTATAESSRHKPAQSDSQM